MYHYFFPIKPGTSTRTCIVIYLGIYVPLFLSLSFYEKKKKSLQSTRFVTSVKDLTEEEKMFLREIAPERPNLIRLKSTMNRLFPHRLFDRFLLRRELTKGLNEYLGSDKDSATKLCSMEMN